MDLEKRGKRGTGDVPESLRACVRRMRVRELKKKRLR